MSKDGRVRRFQRELEIPKPSGKQVENYLKLWDSLENYVLQESSLRKLFSKTYPLNNSLDEVLIKVCSLNDFYSTNIYSPFTIAKHIVALNIDDSLSKHDIRIVDRIARVKINGRKFNFYSFATKYCSHHKPRTFPIYDFYVEKMLWYYRERSKFFKFSKPDLKSYPKFKQILESFRKYYGLKKYDLKQIDQYLWLAGKKYFPRNYSTTK